MEYFIKIKETGCDSNVAFNRRINFLLDNGYDLYFKCIDYERGITIANLERIENGKQTAKN